nr:uncharacterized protein LOC118681553 isoform X1 [Bactrocera oleae]
MTYIGYQICLQSVEDTCIQNIWLNEFSLPLHVHTTLSGRNWHTLLHITPENTTTLSHYTTTRHTAKQQNGWFPHQRINFRLYTVPRQYYIQYSALPAFACTIRQLI